MKVTTLKASMINNTRIEIITEVLGPWNNICKCWGFWVEKANVSSIGWMDFPSNSQGLNIRPRLLRTVDELHRDDFDPIYDTIRLSKDGRIEIWTRDLRKWYKFLYEASLKA